MTGTTSTLCIGQSRSNRQRNIPFSAVVRLQSYEAQIEKQYNKNFRKSREKTLAKDRASARNTKIVEQRITEKKEKEMSTLKGL